MMLKLSMRSLRAGNKRNGWPIALVIGATLLASFLPLHEARAQSGPSASEFLREVDVTPLSRVAVHTHGRFNSLESFARSMLQDIAGPHTFAGDSSVAGYLDLLARPQAYRNAAVIYVKNKSVREQIIATLERDGVDRANEAMTHFAETGLIAPALLERPSVRELLNRLRIDVVRTEKFVNMIDRAMMLMHPDVLRDQLRIVPPPGAGPDAAWLTVEEYSSLSQAEAPALDPAIQSQIASAWTSLIIAWMSQNAPKVNEAATTLAGLLPRVNPEIYPDQSRLQWESWYFSALGRMKLIWLLYAFSMVPLLLSVVYRWNAARWFGLTLFTIAFAAHLFVFGLRWYVSGHFPNSNMYEAVTTAALFGGVLAVICEFFLRRTAMRNLFAIGSAAASAAAIMATTLFPLELSAEISNRMPVLHDIWLYIHTNVIIFSYALIFMASVTAVLYIGNRLISGRKDYAKAGGAASLIMAGADGTDSRLSRTKASLGEVLDGVTMVLMELSFVLLWAGIVMGAIWADHSWGRPWGWDPKEVFALNTFIVFAILIHGRMKVKDKGMWTALIAIFGCAVMLFNWIVINFVIAGLHSYA